MADGRFHVAVGFNFGAHLGDSILGDVIATHGPARGTGLGRDAVGPAHLLPVVVSELLTDLAQLIT